MAKPKKINPFPAPAWTSPEYLFFVAHVLWGLAYMFWVTYDVSQTFNAELQRTGTIYYGWKILGKLKKDATDIQWRDFVQNLHLLVVFMTIYVGGSRAVRRHWVGSPRTLLMYYCVMNIAALVILHGSRAVFVVAILTGHYALCCVVTGTHRFAVAWTWAYTITFLFLNELGGGYSFEMLLGDGRLAWLDEYEGLSRWHVTFNMSVLRMISFAGDWHEAVLSPQKASEEEARHKRDCEDCSEFEGPCYALRVSAPRPSSEYSIVGYLAFVLYLPTYLGGPITTFNGWVSHATVSQKSNSWSAIGKYALRLANVYFLLELSLHFIFINAIRKVPEKIFSTLPPLQLGSLGFYTLNFLWMKFTFIWRFCRLVAMIDGVEVPENMLRCWANNFSVTGFWKSWHASYNKWIVRYMYVPLGGSQYKAFNVWVIFTFVALWHDITLQLFQWAWMMSLFFLPEFLGDMVMATWWPTTRWYHRHLRAVGGAVNIILLMIANLVGYGVGTSKTASGVGEIFCSSREGLFFAAMMFAWLVSASEVMIKCREGEEAAAVARTERLQLKES